MMNLLHFFYGFGAIAGPVAAGFLSDRFGLTWRQIYLATLVPTAAFALFILFTRFRLGTHAGAEEPTDNRPRLTFGQAFRQPLVWLFSGTLGFMEIIEFGASNWGGLYLKDVYGLDPRVVGAGFVSLFYVLFTVSRLGGGLAIERLGYHRSLLLSCWATIVVLALGFALGRRGIWLLPGTGLFIAIMWPTLMALAMHAFGRNAAICTSAIITLSGAINGLFQLVIGVTNQHLGYAWGYRSCVLYAFAVLIMLHFLGTGLRRNDRRTTAS
jgi:fucose permease